MCGFRLIPGFTVADHRVRTLNNRLPVDKIPSGKYPEFSTQREQTTVILVDIVEFSSLDIVSLHLPLVSGESEHFLKASTTDCDQTFECSRGWCGQMASYYGFNFYCSCYEQGGKCFHMAKGCLHINSVNFLSPFLSVLWDSLYIKSPLLSSVTYAANVFSQFVTCLRKLLVLKFAIQNFLLLDN